MAKLTEKQILQRFMDRRDKTKTVLKQLDRVCAENFCLNCGKQFQPKRIDQFCCIKACSVAHSKKKHKP